MKKMKKFLSGVLAAAVLFTGIPFQAQAENLNLALDAKATASTVEAASLPATNANDGNSSTRWAGGYDDTAADWLKLEFDEATQVKQINVEFHVRDVDPMPCNISELSIKYVDENGAEKYAVQDFKNKASGSGYENELTFVLDEAIKAKSITVCEMNATASQWNNISIREVEVFAEAVDASAITSLDDAVEHLEKLGTTIAKDAETFELPEIAGFTVELNGADYEQLIRDDLTISNPLRNKDVQISYKVTDASGNEAITSDITYTLEGIYEEEECVNSKPVVIPEIQEWHSNSDAQLLVEDLTKVTYDNDALEAIVDEFIADYEDFTGIVLEKEKVDGKAFEENAYIFRLREDVLGEEGYIMEITPAGSIVVAADSVVGNMYAMQTILQMYKQNQEGFNVGIMRDYPRFETRGLLLDIARKPIGMEMINDIAKTMRYYKMNDFQLHLSDNYIFLEQYGKYGTENEAFKAYEAYRLECDVTNEAGESPTAKDYFITKAELKEFIQSQRALGMKIVPEIDMPAHATSFTKIWPEFMVKNKVSPLNGNRPLVDHFDVSKQEAIDKILEIFDDYTKGEDPTFDAETTVHVGADEFVADYTAYRVFVNQLVPHVKETNTVRMWGGFTWINDGKTEIVEEAIEGVEMNLWSKDWADGLDMYNMGYKLINTIDDYGYMVPNGGMGRANAYGDLLNVDRIFSSFAPNKVRSRSGYVTLPSGDDQVLGAAFAIWSDNIDKSASGLSESDLFFRFFDALPYYAEKTWATTGQEKGSSEALAALAQEQGVAPNTNPYYQEDKIGKDFESYNFEKGLEDGTRNNRDLTEGTAKIENGALVLEGGNSYVTSPIDKIGNGTALSFDITLEEAAKAGDILFETTPEYGTHDIRVMEDGKLGFTRELYNYYFNYELPVGETVNIKITAEQQNTSLYVNGEYIGEATGKFIHNDMVKATGLNHTTFAIPLERIGSETNAIKAVIDNVVVTSTAPVDDSATRIPTNDFKVTCDNQYGGTATEGVIGLAFDGKTNTIWHSNYSPYQSLPATVEIDMGKAYLIDQFDYLPRQDGSRNGRVLEYKLYAKLKMTDDWTVLSEGTWTSSTDIKKVTFDAAEYQYLKFVAVTGDSDSANMFASAAEFYVHAYDAKADLKGVVTEAEYYTEADAELYTEESWNAFVEARTAAQAVIDDEDATEEEIAAAEEALTAAMEGLTEAGTDTPDPWVNPFKDVAEGKWYYDAVAWGNQNGVVNGLKADVFGVKENCTRGQIVTFIWRAMGEPAAEAAAHNFTDVVEGKYYYDAMLWAVENGIVTGLTDTTFGPEATCTRQEIATLLYRLAGEPEVGTEIPFSDIAEGKWYTNAVIWAAEDGVVTGYDNGTFGRKDNVSREQTVTMLYRYFAE